MDADQVPEVLSSSGDEEENREEEVQGGTRGTSGKGQNWKGAKGSSKGQGKGGKGLSNRQLKKKNFWLKGKLLAKAKAREAEADDKRKKVHFRRSPTPGGGVRRN